MKSFARSSALLLFVLISVLSAPLRLAAWCAAMGGFPSFEAKARYERAQREAARERLRINSAGFASSVEASRQIWSDQSRLKDLGYYHGDVDGMRGPLSQSSINAFREANGLGAGATLDASARSVMMSDSAVSRESARSRQPAAENAPPSSSGSGAQGDGFSFGEVRVRSGDGGARIRLSEGRGAGAPDSSGTARTSQESAPANRNAAAPTGDFSFGDVKTRSGDASSVRISDGRSSAPTLSAQKSAARAQADSTASRSQAAPGGEFSFGDVKVRSGDATSVRIADGRGAIPPSGGTSPGTYGTSRTRFEIRGGATPPPQPSASNSVPPSSAAPAPPPGDDDDEKKKAAPPARRTASDSELARQEQEALGDLGYYNGFVDGIRSSKLEAAIREFKRVNHLRPLDGTLDSAAREKLMAAHSAYMTRR